MITVSFKEPEPAVLIDHNTECNAEVSDVSLGLSSRGNDMATLGIKLSDEGGNVLRSCKEYMVLGQENLEWKVSEVLYSLGLASKTGDQVEISEQSLIGKKGRVRVIQDTYTDKNGDEQTTNKIGRWLPPETTA
jgi:hypothetical protein